MSRSAKKINANIASRYLILFMLSLDGVLHLNIINLSFMAASFYDFIDELLNKINSFLQHNLVVVSWLVIAADVTTIKGKYPAPWRLSSTV